MNVTYNNASGFVLLDKPAGISSNLALKKVKRLLGVKKAGYCGTLDPFATGILPICLNKATKQAFLLQDADKVYYAVAQFGANTTTGDFTGNITENFITSISKLTLEQSLCAFIGDITQIPPMYSALKVNGQRLYKLARQGKNIERAPRAVKVYSFECLWYDQHNNQAAFMVQCGKGLYVRTLLEDLAANLHTGAYLLELRRMQVAGLSIDAAHSLFSIASLGNSSIISID